MSKYLSTPISLNTILFIIIHITDNQHPNSIFKENSDETTSINSLLFSHMPK